MKYLTRAEYLVRFGEPETIRVTATAAAPGAIDVAALDAAIVGAEELADAYLATRYTLPLPDPTPDALRELVADLARERLHKTRPLPAVTENADRARSFLKDLSAGRAALLVVDTPQDATATAAPAWGNSAPAAVFNGSKLDRF